MSGAGKMGDRGGGRESTKSLNKSKQTKHKIEVDKKKAREQFLLTRPKYSPTAPHITMPTAEDGVPAMLDVACHLLSRSFNRDLIAVMRRAKQSGVVGCVLHCDWSRITELVSLVKQWPGQMFATIGISPDLIKKNNDKLVESRMEQLLDLALTPEVVAVQCGLDLTRDIGTHHLQVKLFQAQLQLARQVKLPVIVWEKAACEQICEQLSQAKDASFDEKPSAASASSSSSHPHGKPDPIVISTGSASATPFPKIAIHNFNGTAGDLDRYLKSDCYIMVNGIVCDTKAVGEAAASAAASKEDVSAKKKREEEERAHAAAAGRGGEAHEDEQHAAGEEEEEEGEGEVEESDGSGLKVQALVGPPDLTGAGAHLFHLIRSGLLPLERVMVSTDAPLHTPQSISDYFIRTSRNEPSNLPHIFQTLAKAYNLPLATVQSAIFATSKSFFSLLDEQEAALEEERAGERERAKREEEKRLLDREKRAEAEAKKKTEREKQAREEEQEREQAGKRGAGKKAKQAENTTAGSDEEAGGNKKKKGGGKAAAASGGGGGKKAAASTAAADSDSDEGWGKQATKKNAKVAAKKQQAAKKAKAKGKKGGADEEDEEEQESEEEEEEEEPKTQTAKKPAPQAKKQAVKKPASSESESESESESDEEPAAAKKKQPAAAAKKPAAAAGAKKKKDESESEESSEDDEDDDAPLPASMARKGAGRKRASSSSGSSSSSSSSESDSDAPSTKKSAESIAASKRARAAAIKQKQEAEKIARKQGDTSSGAKGGKAKAGGKSKAAGGDEDVDELDELFMAQSIDGLDAAAAEAQRKLAAAQQAASALASAQPDARVDETVTFRCRKCQAKLFTSDQEIGHDDQSAASVTTEAAACERIFIARPAWLQQETLDEAKAAAAPVDLLCFKCSAKVGRVSTTAPLVCACGRPGAGSSPYIAVKQSRIDAVTTSAASIKGPRAMDISEMEKARADEDENYERRRQAEKERLRAKEKEKKASLMPVTNQIGNFTLFRNKSAQPKAGKKGKKDESED